MALFIIKDRYGQEAWVVGGARDQQIGLPPIRVWKGSTHSSKCLISFSFFSQHIVIVNSSTAILTN